MITTQDISDLGQHLHKHHSHKTLTLAALLDTTEHLLQASLPAEQGRVLRDELLACVHSHCNALGIAPMAVLAARRGLSEAQVTLAYLDELPA